MTMTTYSDSIARMIDPTAGTLADILEYEAGDYIDDYDIDEGARRYAQKLDYELEPLGIMVTADGHAYCDDKADIDDELVEGTIRGIDVYEILDSVDQSIKNSTGRHYSHSQWPALVQTMDPDIREQIAQDGRYDTDQKFFEEYAKRHLAEHGEEWEPDKADPVW